MLQITISKRAALMIAVALILVVPGIATATHVFTDVTDGTTHAEGIEYVASVGVTAGCGDGTIYCPNDAVTRAQMGTFMCRLSGSCGVAPSVDAATAEDSDMLDGLDSADFLGVGDQAADSDMLDGRDSTAILPIMFGQSDGTSGGTSLTGSGQVEINTRLFAVPSAGYIVISGTVFVNNDDAFATDYELVPKLDGSDVSSAGWGATFLAAADGTAAEYFTLSYTMVVPITAGIHTVSQDLGPSTGTADFFYNAQEMVFVFYPEEQGFININVAPGNSPELSSIGE